MEAKKEMFSWGMITKVMACIAFGLTVALILWGVAKPKANAGTEPCFDQSYSTRAVSRECDHPDQVMALKEVEGNVAWIFCTCPR